MIFHCFPLIPQSLRDSSPMGRPIIFLHWKSCPFRGSGIAKQWRKG